MERFEKATNIAFTSKDQVEIFRAQGEIKALGDLIALPAEIRSYQHDVATGKRVKINPKETAPNG